MPVKEASVDGVAQQVSQTVQVRLSYETGEVDLDLDPDRIH